MYTTKVYYKSAGLMPGMSLHTYPVPFRGEIWNIRIVDNVRFITPLGRGPCKMYRVCTEDRDCKCHISEMCLDRLDLSPLGVSFATRGIVSDPEKQICTCPKCRTIFCDPAFAFEQEEELFECRYRTSKYVCCPACGHDVHFSDIFRLSFFEPVTCDCGHRCEREDLMDPSEFYFNHYFKDRQGHGGYLTVVFPCPDCGGINAQPVRMRWTDSILGKEVE